MAVDKSAYEAAKTKKTKTNPPPGSQPIGFDLTADYNAGRALADQKLQAFNKGLSDRMTEARTFASVEFSNASFELPETLSIKALPPSEETTNSFIGLLYGYQTIEITQD